jgi:hypothetical protein
MGEVRNAYNILVRKFEWNGQVDRLRSKWEDNIQIDLTEVVGCGPDLTGSGE